MTDINDDLNDLIRRAREWERQASEHVRRADRKAAVLTAQADRWEEAVYRRGSQVGCIAPLAAAALSAGPASTREVTEAVRVAAPVAPGSVYQALRKLEAAGDVTGLRMPGAWGVLWAVRP